MFSVTLSNDGESEKDDNTMEARSLNAALLASQASEFFGDNDCATRSFVVIDRSGTKSEFNKGCSYHDFIQTLVLFNSADKLADMSVHADEESAYAHLQELHALSSSYDPTSSAEHAAVIESFVLNNMAHLFCGSCGLLQNSVYIRVPMLEKIKVCQNISKQKLIALLVAVSREKPDALWGLMDSIPIVEPSHVPPGQRLWENSLAA